MQRRPTREPEPERVPSDPVLYCGIYSHPECDAFFAKFADLKYAVFLVALGFLLESTACQYIRATSEIWHNKFNFTTTFTNWLVYCNEFIQIFSLVMIMRWNQIWNRMTWTAGNLALVAGTGLILAFPEALIENKFEDMTYQEAYEEFQVCFMNETDTVDIFREGMFRKGSFYLVLGVLMVAFQLFLGSATISLIINGITFIDDHFSGKKSVICISIFVFCKIIGYYLGNILSLIPTHVNNANIFCNPAWIIICLVTFIFGSFIGLFPNHFPDHLRRIIELFINNNAYKCDMRSISKRLLKNAAYVVNVFATTIMFVGVENIYMYKKELIEAKFYVQNSEYHSIWLTNIMESVLQPILILVIIISSGLIIGNFRPKAITLACWNVFILLALPVLFSLYLFLNCSLSNIYDIKSAVLEKCYSHCTCEQAKFMPVCLHDTQITYFSPCHAGCTSLTVSEGFTAFTNCSCSAYNDTLATFGACDIKSCDVSWVLMITLNILINMFMAAGYVSHIFLTLRCVHLSDRAFALGLEKSLIEIFTYIPGKLLYNKISDITCEFLYTSDDCELHNHIKFPRFSLLLTILFLLVASVSGCVVAFLVRNVDLELTFRNNSAWTQVNHGKIDTGDEEDANEEYQDVVSSEPKQKEQQVLNPRPSTSKAPMYSRPNINYVDENDSNNISLEEFDSSFSSYHSNLTIKSDKTEQDISELFK